MQTLFEGFAFVETGYHFSKNLQENLGAGSPVKPLLGALRSLNGRLFFKKFVRNVIIRFRQMASHLRNLRQDTFLKKLLQKLYIGDKIVLGR